MKQIKKMAQRGLLHPETEDPFALFVASTNIRYCYYSETQKILGNTFGMCVLQVCPRKAIKSFITQHFASPLSSKYILFRRTLRVLRQTSLLEQ
jgi:hypothetical protein